MNKKKKPSHIIEHLSIFVLQSLGIISNDDPPHCKSQLHRYPILIINESKSNRIKSTIVPPNIP